MRWNALLFYSQKKGAPTSVHVFSLNANCGILVWTSRVKTLRNWKSSFMYVYVCVCVHWEIIIIHTHTRLKLLSYTLHYINTIQFTQINIDTATLSPIHMMQCKVLSHNLVFAIWTPFSFHTLAVFSSCCFVYLHHSDDKNHDGIVDNDDGDGGGAGVYGRLNKIVNVNRLLYSVLPITVANELRHQRPVAPKR